MFEYSVCVWFDEMKTEAEHCMALVVATIAIILLVNERAWCLRDFIQKSEKKRIKGESNWSEETKTVYFIWMKERFIYSRYWIFDYYYYVSFASHIFMPISFICIENGAKDTLPYDNFSLTLFFSFVCTFVFKLHWFFVCVCVCVLVHSIFALSALSRCTNNWTWKLVKLCWKIFSMVLFLFTFSSSRRFYRNSRLYIAGFL